MRRQEEKFVSGEVKAAAKRFAPVIRTTRLARNMTQAAAAERARMSAYTWMKIERGDVSVSMGAWLSALECLGLLDALALSADLSLQPPPAQTVRLRARASVAKREDFDF
ncbi:helix-turn-helix domain-containing protein [Rhodocyclus purpureus]|uniref:helix-turn-helix domain-containing protein n=1 Tax=Rhodocyclus purpureus TaxID=1067 RepID=UPI0019127821|nr:helix-turn-helix transcriptional regulator [Rhodocyclus purpureus]MBK5914328.1 hypothetical protein [Rhodocyclus purpureus]